MEKDNIMIYVTKKAIRNTGTLGQPSYLNIWRNDGRYQNLVELENDYLWSNGADWHVDTTFTQWSALLVLSARNMCIQTQNSGDVIPRAGDLIVMDIWKLHRAIPKNAAKKCEIICLVKDFDERPEPLQAVTEILEDHFDYKNKQVRLEDYLTRKMLSQSK